VVTTFTTPLLIRASGPAASFLDRRLPKPLQMFASLYGSWLEQLRASKSEARPRARVGRLVKLLALDAALLGGIVIGVALGMDSLLALLEDRLHAPPWAARGAVVALAMLVSLPFLVGIVRMARSLGMKLAEAALPPSAEGKLDLAAAPRRALVVALQLAVVFLVGMPLLALTQPFVSPAYGGAVLGAVLAVLGVGFWRGATNLEEHVRAGAEMVVEALGKQSASARAPTLAEVLPLLPGLGPLTPVQLGSNSAAVGKTLAEINLRALSGASVITILRGKEGLKPTGREALRTGDVLALAGTHEAIRVATTLLDRGLPPADG
jgi:CPA2 family monovalent cation:H+ antiporter-2